MLNYVAIQILAWAASGPLRGENVAFARTETITTATLPILIGREGHLGILFAAVAVPIMAGCSSAARSASRSAPSAPTRMPPATPACSPRLLIILTMSISGLLAGLAGATEILGEVHHMPASYATSVGFDAIAVALLGRSHPVGILFAGLLFGAMRAGSGSCRSRPESRSRW